MPVLSPGFIDEVSTVLGVVFIVSPIVVAAVSEFVSLLLPEVLQAIKLIKITAVAKTFFMLYVLMLTISGWRPKLLAMCRQIKSQRIVVGVLPWLV